MPLTRTASWTLFAAAGCALLAATAGSPSVAQDKPADLPKRPGSYSEVMGLKVANSVPPEKKAGFKAVAAYFAEYVANPRVYSAPQEFRSDIGPVTPQPESIETLLNQLRDFVLVPQPLGPRVNSDNADYIRELAAELDAAFSKVIKENATPVVRINATRMLAVAARSGAEVHYDTVTDLLTNPNTPPEIKYYAYQAAANLLAAYDFADYRGRRHSIAVLNKVKLGKLIRVVNEAVVAPAQLVAGAKGGKTPEATPEQLAVHGFIRRGAVRALAQVRFASVEDENKVVLYPVHTLARVATSDPALVPPPGSAEIAEAIICICNMSPHAPPGAAKGYNADTAAEAVAVGLRSFAGPRSGNPLDRSIAWKVYSARLSDALRTWRGLFDNTFDPANPAKFDSTFTPDSVNKVVNTGLSKVLGPIDKSDVTVRVDLAAMTVEIEQLRKATKRSTALFPDTAKTTLDALKLAK
jgi:hypothetical protein